MYQPVSWCVWHPGRAPCGNVSLLMGRDKSLSLWLQAPVCPGVDPLVDRARSQKLAGEPQKSLTSADDLVGRARSWAL